MNPAILWLLLPQPTIKSGEEYYFVGTQMYNEIKTTESVFFAGLAIILIVFLIWAIVSSIKR